MFDGIFVVWIFVVSCTQHVIQAFYQWWWLYLNYFTSNSDQGLIYLHLNIVIIHIYIEYGELGLKRKYDDDDGDDGD